MTDVRTWLTEHGVEVLTLLWAAGYLALPTQFRGVPVVAELLVVPTLLLVALWPRIQFTDWRIWLAVPLVGVSLAYAWQVREEFTDFARREVGVLPEQLADLPPAARFAVVIWQRESAVAYKNPVEHLPAALYAAQHGGLTNDSPAQEPEAILHYRKGTVTPQLRADFWLDPGLADVDYVLLRSATEPEAASASPHLEHLWHGGSWWLFHVTHADRARMKFANTSGPGGVPAYADCARHTVLQGIAVGASPGTLQTVQPLCQDLQTPRAGTTPPEVGEQLGNPPEHLAETALLCPREQYVVALTGHTTQYVTAVQVQCATAPWPTAQFSLTPTRLVGADSGKDFDLRCPDGMVGVGIQGRFGDATDAIGLACAELSSW